jgi:aspartate/methionine/tyrosine aminotransferase
MTNSPTTPIQRALAQRVRDQAVPDAAERTGAPGPELLAHLAGHLERGETHYTTRPGMVELRERVAGELSRMGVPAHGAAGVVITTGEGEAVFATLLALEVTNGGQARLVGHGGGHRALLAMLGVEAVDADAQDMDDVPRLVCLGRALDTPGARLPEGARSDDLYVGALDAAEHMAAFPLGFAAGPPDRIRGIMTWKQAWSICSPAPSQRAALYSFERSDSRGGGGQ